MLNVDYTTLMPVTKTAKRALRGSFKKAKNNKVIISKLEIAVRVAKKHPSKEATSKAVSLADKAAKKHTIHKNKAARIKSMLSRLNVVVLNHARIQKRNKNKPSSPKGI